MIAHLKWKEGKRRVKPNDAVTGLTRCLEAIDLLVQAL